MRLKLHISEGNSKLGLIPNVSLPPGCGCPKDAPCKRDCYARRHGYARFASVRKSWDRNAWLLKRRYNDFFRDVAWYLAQVMPKRFRVHVSGDFLDMETLQRWFSIARGAPKTRFLAFTKRYDLMTELLGKTVGKPPDNFRIVISRWPGYPCPPDLGSAFPQAWMYAPKYKDVYIPPKARKCSGSCATCWRCWNLKPGQHVVFHKH